MEGMSKQGSRRGPERRRTRDSSLGPAAPYRATRSTAAAWRLAAGSEDPSGSSHLLLIAGKEAGGRQMTADRFFMTCVNPRIRRPAPRDDLYCVGRAPGDSRCTAAASPARRNFRFPDGLNLRPCTVSAAPFFRYSQHSAPPVRAGLIQLRASFFFHLTRALDSCQQTPLLPPQSSIL